MSEWCQYGYFLFVESPKENYVQKIPSDYLFNRWAIRSQQCDMRLHCLVAWQSPAWTLTEPNVKKSINFTAESDLGYRTMARCPQDTFLAPIFNTNPMMFSIYIAHYPQRLAFFPAPSTFSGKWCIFWNRDALINVTSLLSGGRDIRYQHGQ